MFRFFLPLLGVMALGRLALYLLDPETGFYDFDAGAIRAAVAGQLLVAAAFGTVVGLFIRWVRSVRKAD